jgi:DNA-binding transcriptional ArsR family regulator
MKDGPNIVRIAALIGEHTRAEVLTALLAGRALTASELAERAGVTKATISAHLAKLLGAGLLAVERQGRHRYFRIAEPDIARLLESLLGVAFRTGAVRLRASPREPALRRARVCYDHLAGELGVFAFEALLGRGVLEANGDRLTLTAAGRTWFSGLGIDLERAAAERRAFCRACLDWSERRRHLAGALGAALLARIRQFGWARGDRDSRVLHFSVAGERSFRARLSGDPGSLPVPIPAPRQRRA